LNARSKGESLVANIVNDVRYVVNDNNFNNVYTFNERRMGNIPYTYYYLEKSNLGDYFYTQVRVALYSLRCFLVVFHSHSA